MANQQSTGRKLIVSVILGIATWGGLIAAAIVLEYFFNPPAPRGLQGMPPIPAIFLSAVFFGWIPAIVVGVKKFKKARMRGGSLTDAADDLQSR